MALVGGSCYTAGMTTPGTTDTGTSLASTPERMTRNSKTTDRQLAPSRLRSLRNTEAASLTSACSLQRQRAYEAVLAAVDAGAYSRLRFSVATDNSEVRSGHAAAEALNAGRTRHSRFSRWS